MPAAEIQVSGIKYTFAQTFAEPFYIPVCLRDHIVKYLLAQKGLCIPFPILFAIGYSRAPRQRSGLPVARR